MPPTPSAPKTQPPDSQEPAKNAQPLGRRTAGGFVWLLAQTFSTKFVGIASQLVLAWLLVPEDFGLVGLTYTVTVMGNLLMRAGVQELLIQRPHFRRWATPACWMALASGFAAGVFMLLLGLGAVRFYDDPRLFGLIAVLALGAPIQASLVVPNAHLFRQMRFQTLATINVANATLRAGLTIVFAIYGFGAYSFVLPQPIAFAFMSAVMWWCARPPVRLRLRIRRWRYIIGDAVKTIGGDFGYFVINQGDYIALGLFHAPAVVGQYFFAYNLSASTLILLSVNMRQAIFPTLSQLKNEPKRLIEAFLRAARVLAVVGVPACFLQAAAAGPVLRMLFDDRWLPAIPLFTLLSLGMAFSILHGPCIALVQAQGRYGMYLAMTGGYAFAILTGTIIASWAGETVAVAAVVALLGTLAGFAWLYIAIRPLGHGLGTVLQVIGKPALAAAIAIAPACAMAYAVPDQPLADIYRLIIVLVFGGLLYLPMIRWIAPASCHDLLVLVAGMLGSRLNSRLGQTVTRYLLNQAQRIKEKL